MMSRPLLDIQKTDLDEGASKESASLRDISPNQTLVWRREVVGR